MNEITKSAPLRSSEFGLVQVKRETILMALNEFDRTFRSSESNSGTRYALEEGGRSYPPKRILELATSVPRSKFSGGKPTNDVFVRLGFHIRELDVNPSRRAAERIHQEQARITEPIPTVDQLVEALFAKTWVSLHDRSANLPDSQYPGVYALAYTEKDLTGDRVTEDTIFYVGMSHASIRNRLRQFTNGLEDGRHHSGAGRFFHDFANHRPYSSLEKPKRFFVSFISVPCVCIKAKRSPEDLRKLGVVAQLEWYVLARIRAKINREPVLNKK